MKLKTLETDTFKLSYLFDWDYRLEDYYIHSINKVDGIGAFQISSYSSNNFETKFDLDKEKLDYNHSIIKEYTKFKALYLIDSKQDSNHTIVKWIIGKERNMIFCTYTVAKNDFDTKEYKNEVKYIEEIVNTIEIK